MIVLGGRTDVAEYSFVTASAVRVGRISAAQSAIATFQLLAQSGIAYILRRRI